MDRLWQWNGVEEWLGACGVNGVLLVEVSKWSPTLENNNTTGIRRIRKNGTVRYARTMWYVYTYSTYEVTSACVRTHSQRM